MAEPTSSAGVSLVAISIALLGPMAGPYALIVFAALAGALWPLSAATTPSKATGAWLLLRCTLTAIMLTGVLATLVQTHWGIPAKEALSVVAFFIGALGNGWRPVFDGIASAMTGLIGIIANRQGGPKP